ncbi:MAG: SHOCT domain-containing protein [Propionicimonas sp.]|uniref:SHOCT domain-containing protein n=1 Tax=Propionicimonas sp. TaxID=1955623 RepID=UPI002B1F71A2|nr:SHOCT domain-containing protein [Propionicimonas sp.]MEA4944861.1 SHOCT domain-containing protein [Propionicimonas sp.]MEA5055186.1 SHOCT domain-containing protein [Propionicimonas sp.]
MGLLRTAARASVAANVVGNVQRRQHQRWAAEDAAAAAARPAPPAPPAPAAPAASTNDLLDQLTRLGQLRDTGVLSEAEFDSQKQRILAGT